MIEFAYPYLLLLLLLPIPIRMMKAYRQRGDSVHAPFYQRLQSLSGDKATKSAIVLQRTRFQKFLLPIAWTLLVISAAKPELLGVPIEQTKSARDLMIAVDLSGSMAATDFSIAVATDGAAEDATENATENAAEGATELQRVDRLVAVKKVLTEFAEQRKLDRFGLIVFGDSPYLQVPFTEDHATWLTLLNETEIGMAGQSTVIGDSMGLAIKLFERSQVKNRVLIILTDGNDTGSSVPPVDAAKIAASYDIKVYAIAIGDPETTGDEALDVDTLERVAEITGGAFFQALNPEELAQVYQSIAELEPESFETTNFQPRSSLHFYPVILLAVLYIFYFSLSLFRIRRGNAKAAGQAQGVDANA